MVTAERRCLSVSSWEALTQIDTVLRYGNGHLQQMTIDGEQTRLS
jgi:hypothetical protein